MKIAKLSRLWNSLAVCSRAVRSVRQLVVLLVTASALSACVAQAPQDTLEETPTRAPEEVELTLNLPAEKQECACLEPPAEDRTFLERGIVRLTAGDYIEAVQAFKRYRRLEQTRLAQWEADLAIAYVSMLPRSPFYDVEAARDS